MPKKPENEEFEEHWNEPPTISVARLLIVLGLICWVVILILIALSYMKTGA